MGSSLATLMIVVGLIVLAIWYKVNKDSELDRQLVESLNGNKSLARQLQEAVKGNKGLARRLLAQAQDKYPGKSDRWYVEKIIYDLERDRAGSGRRSSSYSFDKTEVRENIYLVTAFLFLISSLSSFVNSLFRRF